jgi:hypothetical protein
LFYDFLSVFGQKTSLYWMKDEKDYFLREFGQGLNVKMANDQV